MYQASLFYSLIDAAELLECKPEFLLGEAQNKKIELMVGIPPEFKICLSTGKNDSPDYYDHPLMAVPNLLVLEQSHCADLKSKDKKAFISDVSKGYSDHSYHKNNKLEELLPNKYSYPLPISFFAKSKRNPWEVWHIYKNTSEEPLEVTWENVLIPKSRIDRFRQLVDQVFGTSPENIAKAYEVIGFNEDVDKYIKMEWVSIQLIQMIDAGRKFWGDDKVVKDDRSTHPKTEEIEKYLIENYKFSKSVAKKATSILRPEFAPRGRPEE